MKLLLLVLACVVPTSLLSDCCRRHYCDGIRELRAQIASGYAGCCQNPDATARQACLTDLNNKIQQAQSLASAAREACQSGNDILARDLVKQIRDLFKPKISLSSNGAVQNSWVIFGNADHIGGQLACCVPAGSACKPITVSEVGGKKFNPEATGKAVENAAAAGGSQAVTVVPASSIDAVQSCTYNLPASANLTVKFGAPEVTAQVSGSFELANLRAAPNGKSALPSAFDITLSAAGAVVTLTLDKSSPYNELLTTANGHGTLGVALTVDSKSPSLASSVFMGGTYYFALPVQVSDDFRCVTFVFDPARPGSEFTPVDPTLLVAADGPGTPRISDTPCADDDHNGLRDGADEMIGAMMSQIQGYCGQAH